MRANWAAFVTSFVLAVLLTRFGRDLANRHRLFDLGDGTRKVHQRPIPRVGGIGVMIAFCTTLGAAVAGGVAPMGGAERSLVSALFGGGAWVVLAGVWDDLRGAPAWGKFALQMVAAWFVCSEGLRFDSVALPFLGSVSLGMLAVPATMAWIVLITNAVNLIDGLDGLAGSVVALAGGTLLVMNVIQGNLLGTLVLAILVGATLGFLVYNVHPASIFLGDTGSLGLGFLLAVTAVYSSAKAYTLFSVVGSALILALPLFDLSLAIARRALTGRPLFAADQHHIHHLVLRRGLSQRQSVILLASGAAVVQLLALALIYASDAVSAMLIAVTISLLATCAHILGYTRLIRNGRRALVLRRVAEAAEEQENALRALRRNLASARTLDEVWSRVSAAAEGMGLEHIELELEPSVFGFSAPRRLVWTRVRTPEQRGVHLAIEKESFSLDIARRHLGAIRLSYYRENQVFRPHDRALHQLLASALVQALVVVLVEDARADNVLAFPVARREQPGT